MTTTKSTQQAATFPRLRESRLKEFRLGFKPTPTRTSTTPTSSFGTRLVSRISRLQRTSPSCQLSQ